MIDWIVLTSVFKSTTTCEILTFMNVASRAMIKEAKAMTISGVQEVSLTVSLIFFLLYVFKLK